METGETKSKLFDSLCTLALSPSSTIHLNISIEQCILDTNAGKQMSEAATDV